MKRRNGEVTTKKFMTSRVRVVASGCWEWSHSLMSNGYPAVWHKGVVTGGHRVAFELWVGPVPDGKMVCHKCDNKKCINPEHLFCGTGSDNQQDSVSKGRHKNQVYHGEDHPNSKLSSGDVLRIRRSTASHRKLAKQFGVCKTTISKIKNNTSYAKLDQRTTRVV